MGFVTEKQIYSDLTFFPLFLEGSARQAASAMHARTHVQHGTTKAAHTHLNMFSPKYSQKLGFGFPNSPIPSHLHSSVNHKTSLSISQSCRSHPASSTAIVLPAIKPVSIISCVIEGCGCEDLTRR